MSDPLVSVIMNCYNGAAYLRAAIDSVLAQSYPNWEIVFWDNQSTDGSSRIVQSYADQRIKYFYAPKHTLLSDARNCALQKAKGEFLAFLDVDDTWVPAKLEWQTTLFADPAVGFVYGNYWVDREHGARRNVVHRHPLPDGRVLDELLKFYCVGLVTLMVRKSALDSLAYPFDSRYHIIGDLDLVVRLSMRYLARRVQEPVAVYRMHGNNESTKRRAIHADELEFWSNEMKEMDAIKSSPNAHFIMSHFGYIKAMNLILQGKRRDALGMLGLLPWGKLKFRILAALLLPQFIVRRVKN